MLNGSDVMMLFGRNISGFNDSQIHIPMLDLWDEHGNLNPALIGLLPASFLDDLKHDFFRHQEPMTIILIVLFTTAFIFGLLGNLFVISVVVRYRHMRTLTNTFLVNLTLGDLLVVVVCIPMTLCQFVYSDYIYGQLLCKLTQFLQGIAVGVSSLSLLAISLNRYFAIHNPLKAKLLFSKRRTYLLLFLVWTFSIVAFVPILIVNEVKVIPGFTPKHVCLENWDTPLQKEIFSLFIFVLLFALPLTVMVATYSVIGWTLWRNKTLRACAETSHTLHSQSERILRQRQRTVKMLTAVVLIFFVCWFPYYVVTIWLDMQVSDTRQAKLVLDYLYPVVLLLGLVNSAVNPVCYCFMSKGFKRSFLQMCCRRPPDSGHKILLMVRFKSTDDSPLDSIETGIT